MAQALAAASISAVFQGLSALVLDRILTRPVLEYISAAVSDWLSVPSLCHGLCHGPYPCHGLFPRTVSLQQASAEAGHLALVSAEAGHPEYFSAEAGHPEAGRLEQVSAEAGRLEQIFAEVVLPGQVSAGADPLEDGRHGQVSAETDLLEAGHLEQVSAGIPVVFPGQAFAAADRPAPVFAEVEFPGQVSAAEYPEQVSAAALYFGQVSAAAGALVWPAQRSELFDLAVVHYAAVPYADPAPGRPAAAAERPVVSPAVLPVLPPD